MFKNSHELTIEAGSIKMGRDVAQFLVYLVGALGALDKVRKKVSVDKNISCVDKIININPA